jgi:D-alanine-D-alanine ligase
MKPRALLVIGSRTGEDRYGVASGNRVAEALTRRGWQITILHAAHGSHLLRVLLEDPPDVVVPVGFGAPCEDGHIYAIARLAGIPCAGPTPAAGGLMQDKSTLSRIVDSLFSAGSGVRSPRGCALTGSLTVEDASRRVHQLRVPLVVKPAFSGSSEGLMVVQSHTEAVAVATSLIGIEGKVLVQELENPILAEVSVAVLDFPDGPQLLPIVELKRDDVLVMGSEEKFGAEGRNRHIIPTVLSTEITYRIGTAVMELHDAVGCVGLTRTDLLIRPDGEIVVLEMNGIPGLLESSIACDAAQAAGISFDQLSVDYAMSAYIRRPEPRIWDGGAA